MKLDQTAYFAHNEREADAIKELLGLKDSRWVEDTCIGDVRLFKDGECVHSGVAKAYLQFNYSFAHELEILTYLDGKHWHLKTLPEYYNSKPFLSHLGFHLEAEESWPEPNRAPLVQEMITTSHTNPYLVELKRTYHYRIHDARATIGTYLKFIKRIQNAEGC